MSLYQAGDIVEVTQQYHPLKGKIFRVQSTVGERTMLVGGGLDGIDEHALSLIYRPTVNVRLATRPELKTLAEEYCTKYGLLSTDASVFEHFLCWLSARIILEEK